MKLLIAELQIKKNMSNVRIAELLDVSNQQITNYRNGSRKPTFDKLVKMTEVFNCEIHELFETSSDFYHDYRGGIWHGIKER